MEPSSETAPVVKKDPDSGPSLAGAPPRVKQEESEDNSVDPALAIFDDVDGSSEDDDESEFADLDHVGFVEYDDGNYWVCPGFKFRQIPEVAVVKRPLKDLCDAINSNQIILDPDYQREIVWDDARAEGLILSILMGYLPPPVIFNVQLRIVDTPSGRRKNHIRTCVDGKQRLTSILRFMKGEIGFYDAKHKKWYYDQPAANDRKTTIAHNVVPQAVRDFFLSRHFICYEYNELTQKNEEEMFQLVQRGIALTPAEKMRAMSTEWARFARQYEEDYYLVVNLSKQGRASGFRLLLTIFSMVQEVMSDRRRNAAVPTLQASPQALTRMLEEKTPINPTLKLKLKDIFDRYESLVKISSTQLSTRKFRIRINSAFDTSPDFLHEEGFNHVRTFSPLELVAAGILVCYHMDKRTDAQLLDDIKGMRRNLRINHQDLRVNPQCWSTVWEFIQGIGTSNNTTSGAEQPAPARTSQSMGSPPLIMHNRKRGPDNRGTGPSSMGGAKKIKQ